MIDVIVTAWAQKTMPTLLGFKNEQYHGLRYATHDEMKAASFEYIEVFYNRTRLHSTLGYRSPIQYLNQWNSEQHQEKMAA